ncbi:MAG TPA: ATP cone domain-containing protein, partial [Patescibacteria group bacterium]|nr:ATP cone domain-containing protein [Patescibacteria group bacterium]
MKEQADVLASSEKKSIQSDSVRIAETSEAVLRYLTSVKSIRKRDGRIEDFQPEKLESAVGHAFKEAGVQEIKSVAFTVQHVLTRLHARFNGHTIPNADEVREIVALTLIDENLSHVAKKFLAFRTRDNALEAKPVYGKGIQFPRFFTRPGVHPYDDIEWEKRDATITNEKGKVVFEQKGVEVPKFYSQTATNIIVSKYFRGRIGLPEREWSVRQLVDRVAKTIALWGRQGAYFLSEEDAGNFEHELTSILVNQRAAFNSPVWFNVGVNPHPQCSACFINSVQDDMRSILNLAVTEGMLFKYGSGSGVNLSTLRSSKEHLSQSSGKSSGPVSFM